MFGKCNHKTSGYCGSEPYLWYGGSSIDGISRIHVDLYATCDKCGKKFLYAKTHANSLISELCKSEVTRQMIRHIVKNAETRKQSDDMSQFKRVEWQEDHWNEDEWSAYQGWLIFENNDYYVIVVDSEIGPGNKEPVTMKKEFIKIRYV